MKRDKERRRKQQEEPPTPTPNPPPSPSPMEALSNWLESDDPNPPSTFLSQSSSSPTQPSSSSDFYLVGFILCNIVGLKHYTGRINGREMVGLLREPTNPYDPNAIKVLNMGTTQVGYIERASAAVLAPLIDSGVVTVEGIVPNVPGGTKNRFKLPCQVHIFSSIESFEIVESTIRINGLPLISNSDASFSLSESVVVKEKKGKEDKGRSVDDIFRLVGAENEDEKKRTPAIDPPKDVIMSGLFLHQREGLGWLVNRENSLELPPFWEEKEKGGGYLNVLTNYQTDERPEPLRGGIFADDMGLGKTLTLLSLIATNTPGDTSLTGEEEGEAFFGDGWVGKKSGEKQQRKRKKRKLDESHGRTRQKEGKIGPKTTLVVCPPAVFSTWISQLGEHTRRGSFKVYMYYGGDRTTDSKELQRFDLVLTTYSTLAAELSWEDSPIKQIEWFRVILDEAHLIKNVEAQQSKAVIALKAKRRWVVTGTPIQNGSFDLFSLMAFLKFEPFSTKHYWLSLVQRPLTQGDDNGLARLQILMAAISLRRVKDDNLIGLPPKTLETCFVEFSGEERERYDQMELTAKTMLQRYVSDGSVRGQNFLNVLSLILRLRQVCDNVALWPSDVSSLLESNNIEDVANDPELLKKMVSILQDAEEFDCPICISPPTNAIITCCAHIFCRSCILKVLKSLSSKCPLCRHPLTDSDIYSAPLEASDSSSVEVSSVGCTSSKVSALLKLLVTSRNENPSTKSVIFSSFREMLILLEGPLKAAGFAILRLDGSLTAKKRAQVIEEFGNKGPDAPTVLLASLKASGAGINLTAASRVYLLEPWWNPAVEEQAMDRVHRIGQKEDVKIMRLIVRNSIEERVLQLQDRKKKLAREAFKRKGGKETRQIGVQDLRILMPL